MAPLTLYRQIAKVLHLELRVLRLDGNYSETADLLGPLTGDEICAASALPRPGPGEPRDSAPTDEIDLNSALRCA